MAGVLCRSIRAKQTKIPWIALLLVAFLATATWQRAIASAKQLEGFDEDEFDDAADEEETEFVAPQRPPTRSVTLEPDQGTKATAGSDRDSKSTDTTAPDGPASVGGSGGRSAGQAADWDDEEFEGVTPGAGAGAGEAAGGGKPFFGKPGSARQQAQKARARRLSVPRKPFHPRDFIAEGVFLAFLVIFAINYFVGKWQNEKIALSFANQFATEGNLLAKNFALIGTGDTSEPILVKEGQATFKLYASGRRFCEAMLVTLNLRSRHDLATLAWDALLSSKKDQVDVDVYMNDEDMAPFVLAIVPRKSAKAFIKENADLKEFASMLDAEVVLKGGGGSGKNKWAADELAIIGDSREAAYELLSDVIIDQLFGEKSYPKIAPLFRALHFTDQQPTGAGAHRKVLRFSFLLPQGGAAELAKLMASVPFFIDAVGKFRLSAQAKSKAEAARAKAAEAALKESKEKRQEELQRRKEERRKAEEAKLSPEELARRREKERIKELKQSAPRAKISRMH
ncbi:unnamed protein product [Closterium sp. Yama58-4]|nr:unnamed protein product [Closterium sp. Yama58-4]